MPSKKEIVFKNKKAEDFRFFMIKESDIPEFLGIVRFIKSSNEQQLNMVTAKKLVNMISDVEDEIGDEYQNAISFAMEMSEKFKKTNLYFTADPVSAEFFDENGKLNATVEETYSILKEGNGFWDMVFKALLNIISDVSFDKREKSLIINRLLFFLIYFRDHMMNKDVRNRLKYDKAYTICFIAGYITQNFFNHQVISNTELKEEESEGEINRKLYTKRIYPHYKTVMKEYLSLHKK